MDIQLNFQPLKILGFMQLRIPDDLYLNLNNQAQHFLDANFTNALSYNKSLYGAIEHEYKLPDPSLLEQFLLTIIPSYWKFHYNENKSNKKYKLSSSWINFQKKYEHNPLHAHHGDLSFVIWLKIPYDIEKERALNHIKNSNDFVYETAAFSFVYDSADSIDVENAGEQLGRTSKCVIQLSKKNEGDMVLFPAKLDHMVYPFYTSDDYRISISGNLTVEDNGN